MFFKVWSAASACSESSRWCASFSMRTCCPAWTYYRSVVSTRGAREYRLGWFPSLTTINTENPPPHQPPVSPFKSAGLDLIKCSLSPLSLDDNSNIPLHWLEQGWSRCWDINFTKTSLPLSSLFLSLGNLLVPDKLHFINIHFCFS